MYYYQGPPSWLFTTLSFLGFLTSVIPLSWHLEVWNIGTCMYMLYTALACLIFFVDSIVWRGNIIDWAPAWCDFSTYVLAGYNLAIPAASLCINRRLYHIARMRQPREPTKAERWRAMAIDLGISLGLPLLQIPLYYVVQGRRYVILEDIGCVFHEYLTSVAVVLWHGPVFLVAATAPSTTERYTRLVILASCDILFTIPLAAWILAADILSSGGVAPWISWADTHADFFVIPQIPRSVWGATPQSAMAAEFQRCATLLVAFLFFALFGFAEEARRKYAAWWAAVRRFVFCMPNRSKPSLPTVVEPMHFCAPGPLHPAENNSTRSSARSVFGFREEFEEKSCNDPTPMSVLHVRVMEIGPGKPQHADA
ncbi:Pheromone B alpha 1 receptor [Mycena kentingensis (nom. inval.)]|nr:Pheromone B alpha 1 receptor [Mycena kentingensis (nom. inval.)]